MKKYASNKYIVIYILTFFILFLCPFLKPFINGHDFGFHVTRIIQLANNIKKGCVFSKIYVSAVSGYGYASPMFYGDLFLYPFALLLLVGFPVKYIANITICSFTALGLYISNYVAKKIFKEDHVAFVFTMLYIFSPYYSINVYARFALGEIQAYIFIPLVILGYWSIVYDDKKYWFWLPIGLAFITYSHLLSTLITVFILFLVSLLNIKTIFKNKAYIAIINSAVLYFALTAYYIFPVLEQLASDKFLASNGQTGTIFGTLKERALPTSWIFSNYNIYKIYDEWIPNGVGYYPLALIVVSLFKKNKSICFYVLWTAGLILAFATSHRFPWDSIQSICSVIQFPWRLQLYSILFFALSAGYFLRLGLKVEKGTVIALILLSLSSFILSAYPTYKSIVENDDFDYDFKDESYGTYDYLHPVENDGVLLNYIQIRDHYIEFAGKPTSNNLPGTYIKMDRMDNTLVINYSNNHYTDTYIDLPLIMYKGYSAIDDDGKEIGMSYGDYNVVRVNLLDSEGKIIVEYKGTIIQKISLLVTGLSSACLIITIVKKKKDNDYEIKR